MVFSWGAITDEDDVLLLALLTVAVVVAIGFEFGNGVNDGTVDFAPIVEFVVVDVAAEPDCCTPITFTLENEVKAALFPHSYLAVILF
jgi:hypothetical protein